MEGNTWQSRCPVSVLFSIELPYLTLGRLPQEADLPQRFLSGRIECHTQGDQERKAYASMPLFLSLL